MNEAVNFQQAAGDEMVHAEFYSSSVLMGFKSREAGRPIYEDQDYIRIRVKGQSKTEVCRAATHEDKDRFPKQWGSYERGEKHQIQEGTPLQFLPGIGPAQVKTLEALEIYTVEDMAGLSDASLAEVGMGARDLQKRAQDWLNSNGGADAKIKKQAETIEALTARLDKLEEKLKKKKGRKKKKAAVKTKTPAVDLESESTG